MVYNNTGNNFRNNKQYETKVEFVFSKKGFFDEKGNIREELITEEALEIAKIFAKERLSNSQLRAFFNEIKAINNRLNDTSNQDNKFTEVYPMILMIKSKIEYRASKEREKMKSFKEFLTEAVNYIQRENKTGKGYRAFKTFVVFFESVVGYSYGQGINK